MTDSVQRLRHILYRFKARLWDQAALGRWFYKRMWKYPSPGVVEIVYKEEQDINHYFDWTELDEIAADKLGTFTRRYAREPNIVYSIKGDLVVEPDFGLAINSSREFVRETGTLSHIYIRPPIISYLIQRLIRRRYTNYERLIHCDGFAGKNLCHFVYDVLNPILFLYERRMITETDPILVSEKVYNTPYFKYFREHTFLGKMNWIIQRTNEWIRVRELKKAFVSMEIFKSTYANLRRDTLQTKKIFLNRRSYYQRNIRNIKNIEAILGRYGFETVYAEDLKYEDQVTLFRSVRYFVGIHGAGLTNLIHSQITSVRVLELFAANFVHASFYRFLKILGVEYYDALVGTDLDINWSFTVDTELFEERIKRLMSA